MRHPVGPLPGSSPTLRIYAKRASAGLRSSAFTIGALPSLSA